MLSIRLVIVACVALAFTQRCLAGKTKAEVLLTVPDAGTVDKEGFFRRFANADSRNFEKIVWGRGWDFKGSEGKLFFFKSINASSCPLNVIMEIRRFENGRVTDSEYLTEDSNLNFENKDIYIYIHGFGGSGKSPGCFAFAKAWFGRNYDDTIANSNQGNFENRVVIIVNWGLLSGVRYGRSNPYSPLAFITPFIYKNVINNVGIVGRTVAHFIEYAVQFWGAKPSRIRIYGHSMGAQAAGNVGRFWNVIRMKANPPLDKINSITALDPADPFFKEKENQDTAEDAGIEALFQNSPLEKVIEIIPGTRCVGKGQAAIVVVVHTNPDRLGIRAAVGDIDYYINLRNREHKNQQYCKDKFQYSPLEKNGCSHSLALIYHVRSIMHPIPLVLDREYYQSDDTFNEALKQAPEYFGHYTEYCQEGNTMKLVDDMKKHSGAYSIKVTTDEKEILSPHEEALLYDKMNTTNLEHEMIHLTPFVEAH